VRKKSCLCVLCPLQDKIHKPELWRRLGLVGAVSVLVGVSSLIHIFNNVCSSERGGTNFPLIFRLGALIMALKNSDDVHSGHLNIDVVNGRGKDVWPIVVISEMLVGLGARRWFR
jgi:hypothetical protein